MTEVSLWQPHPLLHLITLADGNDKSTRLEEVTWEETGNKVPKGHLDMQGVPEDPPYKHCENKAGYPVWILTVPGIQLYKVVIMQEQEIGRQIYTGCWP